jgi:hypothetical protein
LDAPELLNKYEPSFLLLQYYYLYVLFRNVEIKQNQPKKLQFRDSGRDPLPTDRELEESEIRSNDEEMQIIEEEDSLDFDSSHRSKNESIPQSNVVTNQPTPPRQQNWQQSPIPLKTQTREKNLTETVVLPGQ